MLLLPVATKEHKKYVKVGSTVSFRKKRAKREQSNTSLRVPSLKSCGINIDVYTVNAENRKQSSTFLFTVDQTRPKQKEFRTRASHSLENSHGWWLREWEQSNSTIRKEKESKSFSISPPKASRKWFFSRFSNVKGESSVCFSVSFHLLFSLFRVF